MSVAEVGESLADGYGGRYGRQDYLRYGCQAVDGKVSGWLLWEHDVIKVVTTVGCCSGATGRLAAASTVLSSRAAPFALFRGGQSHQNLGPEIIPGRQRSLIRTVEADVRKEQYSTNQHHRRRKSLRNPRRRPLEKETTLPTVHAAVQAQDIPLWRSKHGEEYLEEISGQFEAKEELGFDSHRT
ncbi:hypothetical protein PgNI_11115 [Pyricularia grisea]|uniref:Uncharacterized protein n=1 Tax=Pyricularia grisea TaxID=148305 RepID=A0A6P8AXE8_PYRGI|nr:hypothetical protein PgNI_11115 [Pyricularia grisea]TLD06969.1 hypothetical protein PgNI_11115 [Pyricularia grisea]